MSVVSKKATAHFRQESLSFFILSDIESSLAETSARSSENGQTSDRTRLSGSLNSHACG